VASPDSDEKRRYLPLFDEPGFRPNPPYVVDHEPWKPWQIAALILLDIVTFGPSAWILIALIAAVSSVFRS
jgi:hypothetical protein